MASRKVFIIPGNGSGDILLANWYKWAGDQINKTGFECQVRNMPDPGKSKLNTTISSPFSLLVRLTSFI
jgi:hypothetical protein